jgi:biopolymer transport protein ExbD
MIAPLATVLQKAIADGDAKKGSLGNQVRAAVNQAKQKAPAAEVDDFRKITIQSDRKMDFLTVKKIMFTVTEAGMQEINFAVVTKPNDQAAN